MTSSRLHIYILYRQQPARPAVAPSNGNVIFPREMHDERQRTAYSPAMTPRPALSQLCRPLTSARTRLPFAEMETPTRPPIISFPRGTQLCFCFFACGEHVYKLCKCIRRCGGPRHHRVRTYTYMYTAQVLLSCRLRHIDLCHRRPQPVTSKG